jgi:hypothetical protein
MPAVQCDPNSIIGPVIQAHGWKVRNGWGFEIYTRLNGRSMSAAVRARRELIKLDRAYIAAHGMGNAVHDCGTDKELLATIQKLWG